MKIEELLTSTAEASNIPGWKRPEWNQDTISDIADVAPKLITLIKAAKAFNYDFECENSCDCCQYNKHLWQDLRDAFEDLEKE